MQKHCLSITFPQVQSRINMFRNFPFKTWKYRMSCSEVFLSFISYLENPVCFHVQEFSPHTCFNSNGISALTFHSSVHDPWQSSEGKGKVKDTVKYRCKKGSKSCCCFPWGRNCRYMKHDAIHSPTSPSTALVGAAAAWYISSLRSCTDEKRSREEKWSGITLSKIALPLVGR